MLISLLYSFYSSINTAHSTTRYSGGFWILVSIESASTHLMNDFAVDDDDDDDGSASENERNKPIECVLF